MSKQKGLLSSTFIMPIPSLGKQAKGNGSYLVFLQPSKYFELFSIPATWLKPGRQGWTKDAVFL